MPSEEDETVTGLLALLGARLAPSDDMSANVVLAAQAAKARMQGSDSDGKAFTDVMEIKSDSRRFTIRANAYGNYARFGRTYTPEQLRQHREFLAKEEQEQQQKKARQAAEREARRQDKAEKQQQEKARRAEEKKAATPVPLTSDEARQQAQAEKLTLLPFKNGTGYFGVTFPKPGHPKPYRAQVTRDGSVTHLGNFATAEEAALYVARSPEGQAAEMPDGKGGKHENMKAWSIEEDRAIIDGVTLHGHQWRLIVQALPGRSVSSTRNRFNRLEKGRKMREAGTRGRNMCHACWQPKKGHICTAV